MKVITKALLSSTFFPFTFRSGMKKSFPYTTSRGFDIIPTTMCVSSSSSKPKLDTSVEIPSFNNKDEYFKYMLGVSSLPNGFATGTATGTFIPNEAPSLGPLPIKCTIIYLIDGPTKNWAAAFTSNRFPGSPIHIGRDRLSCKRPLQALVINNRVSNVCSSGDGIVDAERVCDAVSQSLNLSGGPSTVLPSSTGVIGWRIPTTELCETMVPEAVKNLQTESAFPAARDIMTTDRYPKLRSQTLSNGARIVGIVKGAGMIEPNMATMLCFILTDAIIPKSILQATLSDVVNKSFNSISVDGDESPSDTVVLVSSNLVDMSNCAVVEFKQALSEITLGLASDLVRNGEGTGHVMRVCISQFPGTDNEARMLGRHIVDSPLFKCAVSGNDPNIGRLAGAVGSFLGKNCMDINVQNMIMTLGGNIIFENGKFVQGGNKVEQELSEHMKGAQFDYHEGFPRHQLFVDIGVNFRHEFGRGSAIIFGSDLTSEYVAINADYRS